MRNKDFKDRLTELSAYVAKKVMVSLFMLGSVASAQMNTYPQVYSSYPQIYFYYGTDFTPTGLDTSKLELKVSHTFDSESVAFTKNDTSYFISDIQGTFDDYIPSYDLDQMSYDSNYQNYYMNLTDPNGKIVDFKIPSSNKGKLFRFTMRAYVQPTCLMDTSAGFSFELVEADKNVDCNLSVYVFDDAKNVLLGMVSYDSVSRFRFSDIPKVKEALNSEENYQWLCFVVNYTGYLPDIDDGAPYFMVSPEFTRMSCSKVSIDNMYLDIVDAYSKCKGETAIAHALGFRKDAYYNWYLENADGWQALTEVSGKDSVNLEILVDFIGERRYKVVVDSVTVFLNINGEDCGYVNPNDTLSSSPNVYSFDAADSIINVYSVDGAMIKQNVRLSDALKNLKRGFYIVGDKKIYVTE